MVSQLLIAHTDSNQSSNLNPNKVHLDPTHPSNPYYIGANENSGALLVSHPLDSNNYYTWARSMKKALRIKNKLGFINGSITELLYPNNPLIKHWLRCNDIMITLL